VFLIDVPGVDYLCLTSFEHEEIAAFHNIVVERLDIDFKVYWKQYKGISSEPIFAGVAE
jgi:hypothetical protein